MWVFGKEPDVDVRTNQFRKKWNEELAGVFANLEKVRQFLERGVKSEQLKRELTCVHGNYDLGVISIDEKGRKYPRKPKPFRLYVFADEQSKTLHLITLGDKETQEGDVKIAKAFVQGLLKDRQ